MASVETLGTRVCAGGTSAGVVCCQNVGRISGKFSPIIPLMIACMAITILMGVITKNPQICWAYQSLGIGLGVMGSLLMGLLSEYQLRLWQRESQKLASILDESEVLGTIRSSSPGLPSLQTAGWMRFMGWLLIGLAIVIIVCGLMAPPGIQGTWPFIVMQGGWLLMLTKSCQPECLKVTNLGLVWEQVLMTTFVPWDAIERWEVKDFRPDPILKLKVKAGRSEKVYLQIGLPGIGNEDRGRLVGLMGENCGEGVLSGKVGA